MSKKIEMVFYNSVPSKKNTGMKYVLFEITTDESEVIHDWGFADWLGDKWDDVPTPEGFTTEVKWWANTVDPAVLLKEPARIVRV